MRARMSEAALCGSPAGGSELRHAGWDLGKPRVLSLTLHLGTSGRFGLGRGFGTNRRPLERGWALRKPWAGLGHRGGSQPMAWLEQVRRFWVGAGTAPSSRDCPDILTLGHAPGCQPSSFLSTVHRAPPGNSGAVVCGHQMVLKGRS